MQYRERTWNGRFLCPSCCQGYCQMCASRADPCVSAIDGACVKCATRAKEEYTRARRQIKGNSGARSKQKQASRTQRISCFACKRTNYSTGYVWDNEVFCESCTSRCRVCASPTNLSPDCELGTMCRSCELAVTKEAEGLKKPRHRGDDDPSISLEAHTTAIASLEAALHSHQEDRERAEQAQALPEHLADVDARLAEVERRLTARKSLAAKSSSAHYGRWPMGAWPGAECSVQPRSSSSSSQGN